MSLPASTIPEKLSLTDLALHMGSIQDEQTDYAPTVDDEGFKKSKVRVKSFLIDTYIERQINP